MYNLLHASLNQACQLTPASGQTLPARGKGGFTASCKMADRTSLLSRKSPDLHNKMAALHHEWGNGQPGQWGRLAMMSCRRANKERDGSAPQRRRQEEKPRLEEGISVCCAAAAERSTRLQSHQADKARGREEVHCCGDLDERPGNAAR